MIGSQLVPFGMDDQMPRRCCRARLAISSELTYCGPSPLREWDRMQCAADVDVADIVNVLAASSMDQRSWLARRG